MSCSNENDGLGKTEEIFGEFYLRVNGHSHSLLSIGRQDAISIAEGDTIYFAPMIVQTDMPFRNAEDIVYFKELIVGSQLHERDRLSGDDFLGSHQADYSDGKLYFESRNCEFISKGAYNTKWRKLYYPLQTVSGLQKLLMQEEVYSMKLDREYEKRDQETYLNKPIKRLEKIEHLEDKLNAIHEKQSTRLFRFLSKL